jgi:hypothetical protein
MFSVVDDDLSADDSISGRTRCMHKSEENYDIMNVRSSPEIIKSSLKPFPPNSSLMPILIVYKEKKMARG